MARTPTQTPDILAQDIQRLARILRRAQENDSRPAKVNQELIGLLNRSIAILAGSAGASVPVRRTGT
jgi:hypothetical protein